jgi:hypothetical protein
MLLTAFVLLGCSNYGQDLVEQTETNSGESTSTTPESDQAGGGRSVEVAADDDSTEFVPFTDNEPLTVAADDQPSDGRVIQLSAGAMLPQSLPQGTVMTFTAEYKFVAGQQDSNKQYVWVVEGNGKQERVRIPRLQSRGQLPPLFSRVFKVGDAPYRSYIEEWPNSGGQSRQATGKRISNVIPLR